MIRPKPNIGKRLRDQAGSTGQNAGLGTTGWAKVRHGDYAAK